MLINERSHTDWEFSMRLNFNGLHKSTYLWMLRFRTLKGCENNSFWVQTRIERRRHECDRLGIQCFPCPPPTLIHEHGSRLKALWFQSRLSRLCFTLSVLRTDEKRNLKLSSQMITTLSFLNGLTGVPWRPCHQVERRYQSRLQDVKDRLEQSDSTNRSLQNYVQFLKASYANVFGDSALTSTLRSPSPIWRPLRSFPWATSKTCVWVERAAVCWRRNASVCCGFSSSALSRFPNTLTCRPILLVRFQPLLSFHYCHCHALRPFRWRVCTKTNWLNWLIHWLVDFPLSFNKVCT